MLPPGHEPFLRAICESPEDDTVRLVFADWLDENEATHLAPSSSGFQIQRAATEGLWREPKGTEGSGHQVAGSPRRAVASRTAVGDSPGHLAAVLARFVSGATATAGYLLNRADVIFAATPVQFLHVKRLSEAIAERFGSNPGSAAGSPADRFRLPAVRGLGSGCSRREARSDPSRWLELREGVGLSVEAARAALATLPKLDRVVVNGSIQRATATVLSDRLGPNARWHRAF